MPLSCFGFGKLVFLHVIDIREVGRMFPCWACILPSMTNKRCLRQEHFNIHVPPKFQMVESKLQMDKAHKLSPLLGNADPRWSTIHGIHDHIIITAPHVFLIRADCGLNLRWLPIILILLWIPSWEPGAIEAIFRDPLRWLGSSGLPVGIPRNWRNRVVESITSRSTKISWKCEDESLCT